MNLISWMKVLILLIHFKKDFIFLLIIAFLTLLKYLFLLLVVPFPSYICRRFINVETFFLIHERFLNGNGRRLFLIFIFGFFCLLFFRHFSFTEFQNSISNNNCWNPNYNLFVIRVYWFCFLNYPLHILRLQHLCWLFFCLLKYLMNEIEDTLNFGMNRYWRFLHGVIWHSKKNKRINLFQSISYIY